METERDNLKKQSAGRLYRRADALRKVRHVKKSVILGALILLIIAIFLIANWPQVAEKQPSRASETSTPRYQTVLPSGKTIKDLGGWKKLTPPNDGTPFYSYTDLVNGVAVNVSQQQLPPSFQSNTNEKVAELAKAYNATSRLQVGGLTVYIGLSAKGPQSVIFAKDNLLVFIKSEKKISDDAWKSYITSLGIPSSTNKAQY